MKCFADIFGADRELCRAGGSATGTYGWPTGSHYTARRQGGNDHTYCDWGGDIFCVNVRWGR
eukprot:3680398-Amphidinium_carterae.1